MDVEVLGILHGGRGPNQDMILVQLHGAKPEYTGVVAGMSGSPVYVDGKLMGALAYRIGQFSRDPIAGITPIEQMLQVRDLPVSPASPAPPAVTGNMNLQPMETPLTMSGFGPEAIRFWQQHMAGTGLEMVAAGGNGQSASVPSSPAVGPGSAVSAQLVRGDMEIAATCTVTYTDAKHLLACGHPLFQLGSIQLPMTASEVVATLASPLNAFKIVNTGAVIGTFTEDRDAAIRGEFGRQAHMIPMRLTFLTPESERRSMQVEILDQPALTPQAAMVVMVQMLTSALSNTAIASYHIQGHIRVAGLEPIPVDQWAVPTDAMPAPIAAAVQLGERVGRIYSNSTRTAALEEIELEVQELPRKALTEIRSARLLGPTAVLPGETVEVEATLRPFQQEERRVRMHFVVPARLAPGPVRLLLSDAATLDRTLNQPPTVGHTAALKAVATEFQARHAADHIYLTLLLPETQAAVEGQTIYNVPLSLANTLEPLRARQDASLHGESAEPVAEIPTGELITGFELLTLHILPGAGVN